MTYFRSHLNKMISWLLILALLNVNFSCTYYYYKVEKNPSIEKLDLLKESPNYMIIHQSDLAFHLSNVKVDQPNQTMSGVLQLLPPDHLKYKDTKKRPGATNRYEKKSTRTKVGTPDVINEVHLYVENLSLQENQQLVIPFTNIKRIEIYDQDVGTTVIAVLGTFLAVGVVIMTIYFLTKSSCPFVYVNNGEEYAFAGEIYSGAIFKCLERDDYLLLPRTSTEAIDLNVANMLKEEQYVNQLSLLEVSHPEGTNVLPAQDGTVHLVNTPVNLMHAQAGYENITKLLQKHDSIDFAFNSENQDNYFNEVVLTFPREGDTREGHLVLHTKNSLWGDYVFGEFTKLFGTSYSTWIDKQNKRTEPEMKNWKEEQGLAMQVYLETKAGWKLVDNLDLVGPLAYRDLVIPIDLSDHTSDQVKIKLTTGFMMWDLDYAGMDYTADERLEVRHISPTVATTHEDHDVLPLIQNNDTDYLIQKNVGDYAKVLFPKSKKLPGVDHDYILHSRGYYNHVREYTGDPQRLELLTFKSPGRFSRFSKEKLDEMNMILQHAEISASTKVSGQ